VDILEILYDNPPKSRRFLPRKVTISDKKTLLFGTRGSGKSSIIIDYLSGFSPKAILYIDFSDIRVEAQSIQELQNFIDKNQIKLVVMEHFNYQCRVPNANEVILSCTKALNIEGFKSVFVAPLDFEEFMSFDKKHQNIEHIFNLFTNVGTYPAVVIGQEEEKHRHIQSMLRSFLPNQNELEILKTLTSFQSKTVSVFKIYELMRAKMPLSKDTIYKQMEALEEEFYIYFVAKFGQERANKKFYFADFALKNALSFEKDFLARFENMVFCELVKRESDIFYTDSVDFYLSLKNTAVLCVPFLPAELIKRRFVKLAGELKTLGITELQVVTIGNEGRYEQDGIVCEIVPFWEWAMR
jgi:predicted AAA+ superfamily ATPase